MTSTYRYNPDCPCSWCRNNGQIPKGTPSNGHSFGYGTPHQPADAKPPAGFRDELAETVEVLADLRASWLRQGDKP